jgi:hypothetical protein
MWKEIFFLLLVALGVIIIALRRVARDEEAQRKLDEKYAKDYHYYDE